MTDREREITGVAAISDTGERITDDGTLLGATPPEAPHPLERIPPSVQAPLQGPPAPTAGAFGASGVFDQRDDMGMVNALSDRDMLYMNARILEMDPSLQYNPSVLSQMVNGFVGVAMADPALFDEFIEQPSLALAHSSDDYLKMKTIRDLLGDSGSGNPWAPNMDALIVGAMETYSRREGAIYSAGQLVNSSTAARGEWEANTIDIDEISRRAVADEVGNANALFTGAGRSVLTDEQIQTAGRWGTVIEGARETAQALKNRGGGWVFDDSGNLHVSITGTEGDQQDEDVIYAGLIRLDPGTEIKSSADAILALLQAQAGTAHRLEDDAEVPGHQTLAGVALQALGGTIRYIDQAGGSVANVLADTISIGAAGAAGTTVALPVEETGDGTEQARMELDNREYAAFVEARERETNQRRSMATPENMVFAAAQQLPGDTNDRIVMAMGLWGSMSPDEQATVLKDASVVDQEELLDRFREKRDEQGALSTALNEQVLQPALGFAQMWDRGVHTLGNWAIHTADLLPGEHEGALELLVTEGFGAFKDSYVEIAEKGDTVAEFLGMEEGAAASWVNFGASVLFDPFTWMTPTGKMNREWMFKQLNDPALVDNYVRNNPAMRDLAVQLVDKGNIHSVGVLMSGGMDDFAVKRLMEIAVTDFGAPTIREAAGEVAEGVVRETAEAASRNAARNEAIGEVFDILSGQTPAKGGMWLPSGPASLQVRQGTLGFANVLKKFDVLSTKDRSLVYQLFARGSRQRVAPITEDGFVEWAERQIAIRFADDAAGYQTWMNRLYDEALSPFNGTKVEQRAAAEQALESIKRQKAELKKSMKAQASGVSRGVATDVPKLRAEIKALEDQITSWQAKAYKYRDNPEIAEVIEKNLGLAELKMNTMRDVLDEFAPLHDEFQDALKTLDHRWRQANDAIRSSQAPKDRHILERWAHAFYDDWGDELGIPLWLDDAGKAIDHPFLPGMKLREWDRVTGDKTSRLTRETIDNLEVLDDVEGLRAIGFGDRGWTPLPASSTEIIGYRATRALKDSDAAWTNILENTAKITAKTLDAQQHLFVTAVLTNLVTPFKTNADEVLRFWTQVGVKDVGPLLKAAVGGTPVGGMVRKAFPVSTRSRGAFESPIESSARNWGKIEKGAGNHWVAAERWVNGSLLEDPIFKEYARVMLAEGGDSAMAREAFREWWESTGAFMSNTTTLRGKEITYQMAFDIVDNSFNLWKGQADDAAKAGSRILEAAATGEKLSPTNREFWKTLGPVPGEEGLPKGKGLRRAQEGVFEGLYGTPGSYRGGVFFDYYYDEALRYYQQGAKILDEKALMATGQFTDITQARRALAAGQHDSVVRNMVATQGFRMERDLEIAAARWARNRADDLMYQMGAVSMFGKKTARAYPFGRAQTDFLDYWWRQSIEPTQLKIGNKMFNPVKLPGGRHVPVNVRLHNRWMKLAAQQDQEGQDPAGSPGWFVRKFTFLPTQFDEGFLLDVIPSPSPVASWLVNWMPEDNPVRNIFGEIHPSHEVFSNYSNNDIWGSLSNLVDSTVPTSSRSLRSGLEAAAKAMLAATGTRPEQLPGLLNGIVNAMLINRESPYMRDYMSARSIEWMSDGSNVFDFVPSDTGALNTLYQQMEQEAFEHAYGQDALDYLKANVAMQNQAGSDALYVRGYTAMIDVVDGWFEDGLISDGLHDEFTIGYDTIREFLEGDGDASVADKRRFADAASDIFNNIDPMVAATFAVDHPEIAVNLVSGFEVDMNLVPQELVDDGTVAGGRIVARGEDGRAAWRRGFDGDEDGATWIKVRDPEEVFTDRIVRAQNYARTYIKGTFEEITAGEIEWEQVTSTSGNRDATVILSSDEELAHARRLQETLGIEFPEDSLQPDGTYRMSLGEFKDALKERRNTLGGTFIIDQSVENKIERIDREWSGGNTAAAVGAVASLIGGDLSYDESQEISYYGTGLVKDFNDDVRILDNEFGWRTPAEWEDIPAGTLAEDFIAEDVRAEYRQRFKVAIMLSDQFTIADYNQQYARYLGDLDYEDPEPPAIADLDAAVTTSDPREIHVVDGDTIEIATTDGASVPFRLLGINTPEKQQEGYEESRIALNRLINEALERGESVTLGAFNAGRYGTTQAFRSDQGNVIVDNERVFAWLYIGGVPVFDPEVFTSVNPRGVGVGGSIPDYQSMYDRALSEGGE